MLARAGVGLTRGVWPSGPVVRASRNVEAHEEGGHCRQVRDAVWCVAAEADQEDRGQPALQVLLQLLREVCDEAPGCWHLALPRLQQVPGRALIWIVWVKLRPPHPSFSLIYPLFAPSSRHHMQVGNVPIGEEGLRAPLTNQGPAPILGRLARQFR